MLKRFLNLPWLQFLFIVLLSTLFLNKASSAESTNNSALTNYSLIIDQAEKFETITGNTALESAFKFFVSDDANLSSLTKEQKDAFRTAINTLRYSPFSGLNVTPVPQNVKNLTDLMDNLISSLDLGVNYPSTFQGKKKKLLASLKIYLRLPKDDILNLIKQQQILSFSDILGTGDNGEGGLLAQLINDRMQEDLSEFKTSDNLPIFANDPNNQEFQAEDPGRSWRSSGSATSQNSTSLRNLISLTEAALKNFVDTANSSAESLSNVCTNLNNKLDSPITFEERLKALNAQFNDGLFEIQNTTTQNDANSNSSFLTNSNYIAFIREIRRLIKSVDNTVPQAQKLEAVQIITKFINKYNLPVSAANNERSQLSRNTIILPDKTIIGLSMQQPSGDQQFLSCLKNTNNELILGLSNTGLMGAAFFKVSMYKDSVVLEVPDPFDVNVSNSTVNNNKFYYLKNDKGKLVIATVSGKSKSFADSSMAEKEAYFNADDKNNFFFQAFGILPKISLLSVATGGFVTQTIDGSLKTAIIGTSKNLTPFTLETDNNGNVIQNQRSSLISAQIIETARILKAGRINNFSRSNSSNSTNQYASKTADDVKKLAAQTRVEDLQAPRNEYRAKLNTLSPAQVDAFNKLNDAANFLSNNLSQYSLFEASSSESAPQAYEKIMSAWETGLENAKILKSPDPNSSSTTSTNIDSDTFSIDVSKINPEIEVLKNAADKAMSESDLAKDLVVQELKFFLDIASNKKTSYDGLKNKDVSSNFENLLQNIFTNFATTIESSPTIKANLTQINYKWSFIKNTNFIAQVKSLNAPKAGQTIAFKVTIKEAQSAKEFFLITTPIKTIDNTTEYILSVKESIPTDVTTHMSVVEENGIFGIKSTIAENLYLAIKNDNNSSNQKLAKNQSDLSFKSLSKDDNNIEKPFSIAENQAMQFTIEDVDQTQISIKSLLTNSFLGLEDNVVIIFNDNGKKIATQDPLKMKIKVVEVTNFYKNLGSTNLEKDDLIRLQRYFELADFINDSEELKYFILDLKNFLTDKKASYDVWNKFSSDSNKINSVTKIINKISDIINNLSTAEKQTISPFFQALKNEQTSGYVESLEDLKNSLAITLKWNNTNGETYYLKETILSAASTGNKNSATVKFSAKSITEPGTKIKINVLQDDSITLQMIDSQNFIQVDQSGKVNLSNDPKLASKFFLIGPHNATSFTLDKNSNLFLGIKISDNSLILSEGFTANKQITPLPSQQVFSIEALSERELSFIQAAKMCYLNDQKWLSYDNAKNPWNEKQSAELVDALAKRINAYTGISTQMLSDPNITLDDKKLLVSEIKQFITDLTTLLHGHGYIEIIGDKDLTTLLEFTIFKNIEKIINNTADLQSDYNAMLAIWSEGYTGSSAFKTGDTVAIKNVINNNISYLNAVEVSYQGSKDYMIQPGETFLGKNGYFELVTYKDKLILKSVAYPGMAIVANQISEEDKRFKPLTRIKLAQLPTSKSTNQSSTASGINFTDPNTIKFQFSFETTAGTNSMEKSGSLMSTGQNSIVSIDPDDENFLKLASSLSKEILTDYSSFYMFKLDPFHKRLSDAYIASSPKEAINIFTEILKDDYINDSTQASFFADNVAATFNKFRKDLNVWNSFINGTDTSDLLSNFSTTLETNSVLFNSEKKTLILSSLSGSATVNLNDFLNSFLSISWKDIDGSESFLTKDKTTQKINWSSNTKIDSNCQIKLELTEDKKQVYIYFSSGADNKSQYLARSGSNIILTNSKSNASPFTITGSKDSYSLKIIADNKTADSFVSLSLTKADNIVKKEITLTTGTQATDGTIRPTALQLFNLYKLSSLERSLGLASNTDPLDRINSYITLATDQAKRLNEDELTLIINETSKMINIITSTKSIYDKLKNDYQATSIIGLLFKTLREQANNNQASITTLKSAEDSWKEGFVGTAEDNTPLDGDIILLQTEPNQYIKIVEFPYQDKQLLHIKNVGTNQLESASQFKITLYKDKFGLESIAYPGYFLCAAQPPTKTNASVNQPLFRIQCLQLSQNTKFGAAGTENFQFKFNKTTDKDTNFLLYSVGQNTDVIFDAKDLDFGRTKNLSISKEKDLTIPKISIITGTALHKKLQQNNSLSSDKEILEGFVQILQNNFVTDIDTANLFSSAMEIFIKNKSVDDTTWSNFSNSVELSKLLKQIFDILKKNNLFTDSLKNLQTLIGKGFVQDLNDDNFITLKWGSVTSPKYLQALTTGQNILFGASATNQNVLKIECILKIRVVPNIPNKKVIQLIFEPDENDEPYILSVQDNVQGQAISRSPAKFLKQSSIKTNAELAKTYFEYQGSLSAISFKSISTKGFLSLGAISNNIATVSESGTKNLAGEIVGDVLLPGSFEQFVAEIMTEYDKELFTLSDPKNVSVRTNIDKLLQYPSFFQQSTGSNLKNDTPNKINFLNAVEKFTQNVVSSETLSNAVTKDDDKAFASLVDILKSLNFSENELLNKIDAIYNTWIQGFSRALSLGVPGDGKSFIWIVLPDTTISTASSMNDLYAKQERVIKVIKDSISNRLEAGVTNVEELIKSKDTDVIEEQLLLINDPFDPMSKFTMMMGRDFIGISSDNVPKNNFLQIDKSIKFSDNKINLESWQKAKAFFAESNFRDLDDKNPSYLIAEKNTDYFVLKNNLLNSYLSVNSQDGCIRTFKVNNQTNVSAVDNKNNLSNCEKFKLIELKEFHQQILFSRSLDLSDLNYTPTMKMAMTLVKNQDDLNFLIQEVCRAVIRKKDSKQNWDAFVSQKENVKNIQNLFQTISSTFNSKKIGALTISNKQAEMMKRQLSFLNGTLYPNFTQTVEIEADVLSFTESLNNLKSKLNSLDETSLQSFVKDVSGVFYKLFELDINNDSNYGTENYAVSVTELADWLEFEVAENETIKNGSQRDFVLEIANKCRNPYKFIEFGNAINFMLSTYPGFSPDRFISFQKVLEQATHPKNLSLALYENYLLDDLILIIRKGMANQCKPHLEEKNTRNNLSWWPKTIKNATSNRGHILNIISLMVYPSIKGKNYLSLLDQKIQTLSNAQSAQSAETATTIKLTANLFLQWDNAIGKGLSLNDVSNEPAIASNTNKNAALKTLKNSYYSSFLNKLTTFMGLINNSQLDKTIIDKLEILKTTSSASSTTIDVSLSNSNTTTPATTTPTTNTTPASTINSSISNSFGLSTDLFAVQTPNSSSTNSNTTAPNTALSD